MTISVLDGVATGSGHFGRARPSQRAIMCSAQCWAAARGAGGKLGSQSAALGWSLRPTGAAMVASTNCCVTMYELRVPEMAMPSRVEFSTRDATAD